MEVQRVAESQTFVTSDLNYWPAFGEGVILSDRGGERGHR